MSKLNEYDDHDLLRYVHKLIGLIAVGDYYSARTDEIKLNCVQIFGDKWIAVIQMMIDLAKYNNCPNYMTVDNCYDEYFNNECNDDEEVIVIDGGPCYDNQGHRKKVRSRYLQ